MTQTLDDLLKHGTEALEYGRKMEAEKEAKQARYEQEFERAKLQAARELLPAALRPRAVIEGESLIITLPGGEKVEHVINVITDPSGDWTRPIFRAVELAENRRVNNHWVAYKWGIVDGDVYYSPWVSCETLEVALALAVELYAGREEVENDAARWRAKMAASEQKAGASRKSYFCPLIQGDCKGVECAWWVEEPHACSLWFIANNGSTL
jgi:hypothetical protein